MRLHKRIVQFMVLSLALFLLAGCQPDDNGNGGSSSSTGLSVDPASKSIAMGASTQLTATYNGTDVSDSATWSSSDTNVVEVSNTSNNASYPKGTITGIVTGSATITVTYDGSTTTAAVTVTSATLSSIQVSPIYPSVAFAATPEIKFTATGIYSDGTKLDLSEYVTWSSSDTSAATISNTAGFGGLAATVATGTSTISAVYEASSGDVTGSTLLTLTSDTIDSLEVTPINPSIADDTIQQFIATILVTDGTVKSTQDVTDEVVWTSGTTATAPISNASDSMGEATALAAGTTAINASFNGTGATASTLTVTAATLNELQVFPPAPSIAKGVDFQLRAKGIFDDGTNYSSQDVTNSALWSSSDASVATVCNSSNCKGKVSALSAGTATITVKMPGSAVTKAVTLTVNGSGKSLVEIQVTPTDPTIYSRTSQQFTATGIYSDGTAYFHEDITDKAIWSSSDDTVAIVSNSPGTEGSVKNIAAGSATMTASVGLISGTSDLTILGSSMSLSSIEVSPANPSIAEGMKQQFTATGVFSDGSSTVLKDITDEVIWTSGTPLIARISNADGSKGEILSIGNGTSTITAALGGTSGTSTLTVFDTGATYSTVSLEITPEDPTITIATGASQKLQAIGIFDDGADDVIKTDLSHNATWSSSDPTVVTVDNLNGNSGLLRGLSAGSATITAYWTDASANAMSDTVSVTVADYSLQSMQIMPSDESLDLNMTRQYQAMGLYSDGTNYLINSLPPELVWMSADATADTTILAPIGSDDDHHGLVTTVSAGTSTISAQYDSVSASETLTTSNLTLEAITIAPSNPDIAIGSKLNFTAYGSYSDGVNRDITHLVRWTSGTAGTALIRNSSDDHGLATTVAVGTSTITAALGSVSGSTTLTVEDSTAAFPVQVTPAAPTIGADTTLPLKATGVFTDGGGNEYSMDITDQVYWSSNATGVATVNNADDANGRVFGVAAGSATITAKWTDGNGNSSTGTVSVTVTSGSVSSIEISPDQPDGPVGLSQQLNATALYSDNNTQDITETVIWSSSDNSVVTVSNVEGERGEITHISYGTATITARFGSNSATATVTVW